MEMRRDFDLLPEDQKFLDDYGLPWETVLDGQQQWLLIHNFPTPEGYNHPRVTVAIRLETAYPQTQLDMVYFFPPLARKDGVNIGKTEAEQVIEGKKYQRWSRHRTTQNPWNPKKDRVDAHVFLIEDWLEREFEKCPCR